MEKAKFGMIGLGVMGRNFLLNVADSGFVCSGYDIDTEKVGALNEEGKEHNVTGYGDLSEFVESLDSPRAVMLLVPAGEIVDRVIEQLLPVLEKGDLIIDGGNSHYPDTIRREKYLNEKGYEFLGVGVSGGAKGARLGPSIMIGGRKEVYDRVAPILEGVSAKVGDDPCAAHLGSGAAGHYVKMVHNGIEYAMMQLICETYDVMKRVCHLDNKSMSKYFEKWNSGGLNSYLTEITYKILRFKDEEAGGYLVEHILDTAGQKGTGRWTSESALEMGIPIPTIDTAVTMRQISSLKELRLNLGAKNSLNKALKESGQETAAKFDEESFEMMLFGAFMISYAQGFSLLKEASKEHGFDLDFAEIAKIWRGGCIIRAEMLEQFRSIFQAKPDLETLLDDEHIATALMHCYPFYRKFAQTAAKGAVPIMAAGSAYNYFTAITSERLPANLLQGQRDFFGSHTYKRTDKEGVFHTEWEG